MTKSSPSSPKESINPALTLQVVGKDKPDHFHDKLYTETPLCPYASLAFTSLIMTSVFTHSRIVAEVQPQLLLILTPPDSSPGISFPMAERGEGKQLVESAYPAAFHPSHPWCTSDSCWTLGKGKGNKMKMKKDEGSSFHTLM